jgi:hypothetical protein
MLLSLPRAGILSSVWPTVKVPSRRTWWCPIGRCWNGQRRTAWSSWLSWSFDCGRGRFVLPLLEYNNTDRLEVFLDAVLDRLVPCCAIRPSLCRKWHAKEKPIQHGRPYNLFPRLASGFYLRFHVVFFFFCLVVVVLMPSVWRRLVAVASFDGTGGGGCWVVRWKTRVVSSDRFLSNR